MFYCLVAISILTLLSFEKKVKDNNQTQDKSREFEIGQITSIIPDGYHPKWSPDCSKIVYTVRTSNTVELWIYEVASRNSYAIVQGMDGDLTPSWSPDSRKIAFDAYESDGSFTLQIWIKDLDKDEPYLFTRNNYNCVSPAWSKDGTKIAFRGENRIFVKNISTGIMNSIPNTSQGSCPDWKYDDSQITFTIGPEEVNDIYVINVDGTNRTKLTNYSGRDDRPQWSPNGKTIAYEEFNNGTKIKIHFIESNKSYLITDVDSGGFPSWSPDGKKIIFTNQDFIYMLDFKEL